MSTLYIHPIMYIRVPIEYMHGSGHYPSFSLRRDIGTGKPYQTVGRCLACSTPLSPTKPIGSIPPPPCRTPSVQLTLRSRNMPLLGFVQRHASVSTTYRVTHLQVSEPIRASTTCFRNLHAVSITTSISGTWKPCCLPISRISEGFRFGTDPSVRGSRQS